MTDPAVPLSNDNATATDDPRSIASNSLPDNVESFLKSYLDDTNYAALKAHFLAKGKGRRPNMPPDLLSTNRILAQLYFLKEDGKASWEIVTSWYRKLFPETVTITMGQIEYHVSKVVQACGKKLSSGDEEGLMLFLSSPFDFNVVDIPDILLNMGLTKPTLLSHPDNFVIPKDIIVTNELIYNLELFRARERLTKCFLYLWINRFLSVMSVNAKDTQIQYKLSNLIKNIKRLQKNKSKGELTNLFSLPFFYNNSNTESSVESDVRPCGCKAEELKSLVKQLKVEIKQQKGELEGKTELLEALSLENKILKEERDLWQQEKTVIQQRAECHVLKQLNSLESKNKAMAGELQHLKENKVYKKCFYLKKRVSSLIKEKAALEEQLKVERTKCGDLGMQLDCLTQKEQANIDLQTKCSSLQKSLKKEQTMKARYKKCLLEEKALSASLSKDLETERATLKTRIENTNRFTDEVRLTYMALQGEANVAAENATKVVQIVSHHLFKTDLSEKDLPCPSSAINFMSEGSILAQHQTTEAILGSDHFTFATDGTSRQKKHFLEKHIQLSNGKVFFLGFQEVASDDSETLLEACIATFRRYSEVYCAEQESGIKEESVMKEIISKLKCLMSDRAAVMKCFDAKMAQFKNVILGEETSTHFLFCNAHFLLGLSSAVGIAAKDVEAQLRSSQPLGRDNSTAFTSFQNAPETAIQRIIRTSAEILGPRGDEKSGCRQEWLGYMESVSKKSGFTSHRGNRFNNLFMNASALLHHQDDIRIFLSDFVSHHNLKLESVLLDIKDPRIMSFITAIAFFYELFTEPYWKLMNSCKPYGHFPSYVRQMEFTLRAWSEDDFDIFHAVPVFQDFQTPPFIMIHLASSNLDLTQVKYNIQCIAKECLVFLNRQLADFLDGGVFGGEIEREVLNVLNTCPMTNLTGERLFGDFDYDISRRRNASLHFRSTLTMWKHNKTARWMQKQSQRMRKRLVAKAIRLGPKWRKRSREEQKRVMEKVKERIIENKRKKDAKAIKHKERQAATIDAVLSYGGLCMSKEDLDDLMSKPSALENLRAQVRYRKFCRGEDIQVTGNLKTLYNRLLTHIRKQ